MSHYGQTPEFIRPWLDEQPPELPDRVISDALARISQTPERRRNWLPPLSTGSFQTLFRATKFVVAGVIVALFGGFLLIGVLTTQQGDVTPAAIPDADPSPTASSPPSESVVGGDIIVAQDGSGDFITITEAVESAEDGDTILVRPGTYTEAVTVAKNITITGDSDETSTVVIQAPEHGPVSPTGGASGYSANDPYAVLLVDTDATLSSMTFRGKNSEVHASGGAPTLEHLIFDGVGITSARTSNAGGNAVVVTAGSAAVVRENTLVGGGSIGIFDGSEPLIERNELSDGPNIRGNPGDGAIIRGNTIRGTFDRGVEISGPSTALIEDNMIEDYGSVGILIGRSSAYGADPLIRGNTIRGGGTAISLVPGSAPTIQGNELSGNAVGIGVGSETSASIKSNELIGNRVGIRVSASNATLAGNSIRGSDTGVLIGRGGSPTVKGNTIDGNRRGVVIDSGASPVLIDNTICGNDTNLVVLDGAEPALADNEICPTLVGTTKGE